MQPHAASGMDRFAALAITTLAMRGERSLRLADRTFLGQLP